MCAIFARLMRFAAAEAAQTCAENVFNCLDLYHTPPDSGERLYKSRSKNRRIDSALRAGVRGDALS